MRYLIGSRVLGIENKHSDYDYVELDIESGGDFRHIVNERLEAHSHCYHYNKDYRDKVARFEIIDPIDYQFIYNPEDYLAGAISENPLDYRDIWIERMKEVDYYDRFFFSPVRNSYYKRFYHVVYCVECLTENTLQISAEALARVKSFHDMTATITDFTNVISRIQAL